MGWSRGWPSARSCDARTQQTHRGQRAYSLSPSFTGRGPGVRGGRLLNDQPLSLGPTRRAITGNPCYCSVHGTTRNWVTTTGGPHLLIAEEQLGDWRGIEGCRDPSDPADQSDYARACRVTTWLGAVPCRNGVAVVLSGDAGDIAWYPTGCGDEGYLVQWLGADDERFIEPVLRSSELQSLLEGPIAERLDFETGFSGAMRLIDASECGANLQDRYEVLSLRRGRYQARAAYYEATQLAIVVRQISRRPSIASDDR